MKKRNLSLGKRALALALSLVMCAGMLQVTAFAEDGTTPETTTTTEGPTTVTTNDGDADNGSSTTTTTTVVTETTTTVESKPDTKTESSEGTFVQVPEKPKVETEVDNKSTETDINERLNYEVETNKAHINLDGSGASEDEISASSNAVTAEDIANQSKLDCKDSTEVKDADKYTSSITTTESQKTEGKIEETGNVTKNPSTVTEDSKKTEGEWETVPDSSSDSSEVLLPERPQEGTTTREDGTQQVVSVAEIVEDGKVVGYTVTTQELNAEGVVTSTKTEDQRGTKTVVTEGKQKEDTVVDTKTTETKTEVEGVKKDTVVTETTTKTTEVSVDNNTLSVGQITIRPDPEGNNKSDKIVATSADVSIKQTVNNGESTFTTDLDFTVKLEKEHDGLEYRLTVYQGNKAVSEQSVKVYTGEAITISGLKLETDGNNGSAEVKIELKPNDSKVQGIDGLDMTLQVQFKDIQGVQASAKQTEAVNKETETTTTK